MSFVTEKEMQTMLARIRDHEEKMMEQDSTLTHANISHWGDFSIGSVVEDGDGNLHLPKWWTLEVAVRNLGFDAVVKEAKRAIKLRKRGVNTGEIQRQKLINEEAEIDVGIPRDKGPGKHP